MTEVTQRDVMQTTLRIAFFLLLAGASLWIFAPFLLPTIWAATVVIATWPMMIGLQTVLGGRRGLAVCIMTAALLMVLVVPFSIFAVALVTHAREVRELIVSISTEGLPPAPVWVHGIPVVGPKAATAWKEALAGGPSSLVARIAPYLGIVFQWLVGQIGSLGMLLVQFLLTVVVTGILFSSGEAVGSGMLRFGRRLGGEQGIAALILASKAIRGIALGVVGTALAQTLAAGLGLAVAGVPGAPLLTALILVLCIAQLGPVLILFPAVGWLFWSGSNLAGALLLIWSLIVSTMDNFIRPMLIKKGVDLPLLLIMSGVMGGLVAFGLVGIFVGPVVLAVTYTLLTEWVEYGEITQP